MRSNQTPVAPDDLSSAETVMGDGDWTPLNDASLQLVGEISISTVIFDPTKRQTLDAACLDGLFNRP
jgi:hypothetical protein